MGWFSDDSAQAQAYEQVVDAPHRSQVPYEVIAGAAAYEAAKKYENHVADNGQPPSYEKAKEILAALSGAIVDRIVETKGLDFVDREKAKYSAKKQYEDCLANDYELNT